MSNRSIISSLCHGVLMVSLLMGTCVSSRAGGKASEKNQAPTYLESTLTSRKGTIEVEWELKKIKSTLAPSPNLYRITILSPAHRPNVSLLVNGNVAINVASEAKTFDFDFSKYGKGEIKVDILVFDTVKAGSSSKTVEVIPLRNPVVGFAPPGMH